MLANMLREAWGDSRSRLAVVGRASAITYEELLSSSTALATQFAEHGIVSGTRLCFIGENPGEFAATLFAAASLGAILVAAPALGDPSCSILREVAPSSCGAEFTVLSGDASILERSRAARLGLPTIPVSLRSSARAGTATQAMGGRQTGPVLAEAYPDRAAVVLRSQSNLLHEARGIVDALDLQPIDRILCTLPVQHSPGLCLALLAAVRARATVVVACADRPGALEALVAEYEPTVLVSDAVTLTTQRLGQPNAPPAFDRLRRVVAPRSDFTQRIAEVRARFPGKLTTFYHCLETGVVALNAQGTAADCLGQPLAGVRVFLERGWEVDAAAGTTWNFGSFVCFRSFPQIVREESGQVNEPGVPGQIIIESPATARAVTSNGRFHTPDRGFLDAEGRLHVLPRDDRPALATRRSA